MKHLALLLATVLLLALALPASADYPSPDLTAAVAAAANTQGAAPMGFPAHAATSLSQTGADALIFLMRPQSGASLSADALAAAAANPAFASLLDYLLSVFDTVFDENTVYSASTIVQHGGRLHVRTELLPGLSPELYNPTGWFQISTAAVSSIAPTDICSKDSFIFAGDIIECGDLLYYSRADVRMANDFSYADLISTGQFLPLAPAPNLP